jgi:hypothetical protein
MVVYDITLSTCITYVLVLPLSRPWVVVRRALKGEKIARRNAEKIIAALDWKFQDSGAKGHIVMGSIKGLQIAELQRKKSGKAADQAHHT